MLSAPYWSVEFGILFSSMPGIMYTPPSKAGSGGGGNEEDEDIMEVYEDELVEEIDVENPNDGK